MYWVVDLGQLFRVLSTLLAIISEFGTFARGMGLNMIQVVSGFRKLLCSINLGVSPISSPSNLVIMSIRDKGTHSVVRNLTRLRDSVGPTLVL